MLWRMPVTHAHRALTPGKDGPQGSGAVGAGLPGDQPGPCQAGRGIPLESLRVVCTAVWLAAQRRPGGPVTSSGTPAEQSSLSSYLPDDASNFL